MTSQQDHITATIKDYGYTLTHVFRKSRGGGVGFLIHNTLKHNKVTSDTYTCFEHLIIRLKCTSSSTLILVVLYRLQETTISTFWIELNNLLIYVCSLGDYIIISGDFNIHVNKLNQQNTKKLLKIIANYDLYQHVSESTHVSGNQLDCVIASKELGPVNNIVVENLSLGDHFLISFNLNVIHKKQTKKNISFRRLNNINHDMFSVDIGNTISSITDKCNKTSNFNDGITMYESEMLNTINKHAPIITKEIRVVSDAPWFDSEYTRLRRERRKCERRWKKSGLEIDREIFVEKRKETTLLAFSKKVEYYSSKINEHANSQQALYKFTNTFFDKNNQSPLPAHEDNSDDCVRLATEFNEYFVNKPKMIREQLLSTPCDANNDSNCSFEGTFLLEFEPTTIDELREIVHESSMKSSNLDSLPLDITKKYLDELLPVWCTIINLSLKSGSVDGVKTAEISPMLKSQDLDPDIINNYRPISNLNFIGKLLERVVLRRLNDHMNVHNLHMNNQSGYKKSHSTETLLLKLTNDLLILADKESATILFMLDLSAAFDTVDHNKLLDILFNEIGLRGTVLKWFKSFLTGRNQYVRIDGSFSDTIVIEFGVPQGSVLGPVLFNIYI